MNARRFLTAVRPFRWLAPLLALTMLAGVAGAVERVQFPQDRPLPFYAFGLGHSGTTPEDWVLTAFCYPPDSFKANYSLWDQPVALSLLPDQPCLLEGFAILADGPTPIQEQLSNVAGVKVPIWFTPVSQWDFTWTVQNMKKQHSVVGLADSFQRVLQPLDPSDPYGPTHVLTVASGVLEDGRSFFVHSELVFNNLDLKEYEVIVRFGE